MQWAINGKDVNTDSGAATNMRRTKQMRNAQNADSHGMGTRHELRNQASVPTDGWNLKDLGKKKAAPMKTNHLLGQYAIGNHEEKTNKAYQAPREKMDRVVGYSNSNEVGHTIGAYAGKIHTPS